jgi:hypothetical protein
MERALARRALTVARAIPPPLSLTTFFSEFQVRLLVFRYRTISMVRSGGLTVRSALILLLALSFSGAAQVMTFQAGAVREDVFQQFGAPKMFWASEPGKRLFGDDEYRAALGIWSMDDVYERQTAENRYEIRVKYSSDARESRLNPKKRITSLDVLVDKPGSYRKTLADSAEAREICASGCKLYGITGYDIRYDRRYYILAYPIHPSAGQLEAGMLAATGYKPDGARDKWCIAVKLNLEGRVSRPDPQPPDWANGKIDEIAFRPANLTQELTRESWTSSGPAVELGAWQPEK